MNKDWQKELKVFLMAGMTPNIMALHRDAINEANAKMLRAISWLSLLGGALLFVSSYLEMSLRGQLLIHMLFVAIVLLLLFMPDKNTLRRRSIPWMYCAVGVLYFFAIINSVVTGPSRLGVYICVALAVLPGVVTDTYWRCVLPGLVAWPIYALCCVRYCQAEVRTINLVNTFISLVIGMVVGYSTIRNRAAELAARDLLLGQRDTDPLTKAVSRRSGEERIRAILDRGDTTCAVIMVDVDNFKGVNDTFGHDYGDKVLAMVSGVLINSFRSTDLVCRLGGDEFMVFVTGVPEGDWIKRKAEAVLTALAQTPPPGGKKARISTSMGIVQSPKYGVEFGELYRKADNALYKAKQAGKNRYHLFGSEQGETAAATPPTPPAKAEQT